MISCVSTPRCNPAGTVERISGGAVQANPGTIARMIAIIEKSRMSPPSGSQFTNEAAAADDRDAAARGRGKFLLGVNTEQRVDGMGHVFRCDRPMTRHGALGIGGADHLAAAHAAPRQHNTESPRPVIAALQGVD